MLLTSALCVVSVILGAISSLAAPVNNYGSNQLAANPDNHDGRMIRREAEIFTEIARADEVNGNLWARDASSGISLPILVEQKAPSPVTQQGQNEPQGTVGPRSLEKRSKVGNWFKNLGHKIKSGFQKVGHWLKDNWQTVLQVGETVASKIPI